VNIQFHPVILGHLLVRVMRLDGLAKNGGRDRPRIEISSAENGEPVADERRRHDLECALREADRVEESRGPHTTTHWTYRIIYTDLEGNPYATHYRISLDRFRMRVSFVYLPDVDEPVE